MKKILLNCLLISLLIFIGVAFINTKLSLAQDSIMKNTSGFKPSNCADKSVDKSGNIANSGDDELKQYCGAYQLNDFVALGIKVAQIMLGLVGTLAFAMFIYGGVCFLISAGRKDYVEKGKSAMINAVIGLFIVFSSYLIIQFTMQALGYLKKDGTIAAPQFSDKNGGQWNNPPTTGR